MDLIEEIASLEWGLSKQEYRNVFSDKQWQPDHPTQNAVGFYDTIQDRTVFVVAYFLTDKQDKLGKIIINFEGIETDTQRKYIFENQIKYLTEKYGKPARSTTTPKKSTAMPECCLSEQIIWKTNDTVIDASLALSKHDSPNPFLGITFFDRQNDPFIKKFADWTENDSQSSDNQTEKNQTKNLDEKLGALRLCVTIYTSIFSYAFLRMLELRKNKSFEKDFKLVDEELEKIYGRLISEWPKDIESHYFEKLWFVLPQEQLFKFFRETIYYLIFICAGYARKYVKPSEHKLMLDRLFEMFEISAGAPWLEKPPEKDAFNKYNNEENPMMKYHIYEIGEIESDALMLMDYQIIVTGTFKYMMTPWIDKIFEDKKEN